MLKVEKGGGVNLVHPRAPPFEKKSKESLLDFTYFTDANCFQILSYLGTSPSAPYYGTGTLMHLTFVHPLPLPMVFSGYSPGDMYLE